MTSIDYSVDDAVPDLPLQELDRHFQILLSNPLFSHFPNPSRVSVAFVTDPQMAVLNQEYRKIEGPTDILTFVLNETFPNDTIVGELIISVDTAKQDAEELHIPLEKEYAWLFSHGLLHLAGYDHHTPEDLQRMRNLENQLLSEINPEWGGTDEYSE